MSCKYCSNPEPVVKPPPIRISIEGFEAHAPMGEGEAPINWLMVKRLPAFEMFAAEQFGVHPAHLEPTRAMYQRYCEWHRTKGQWPNETPLGEYIGPSSKNLQNMG